MKTNLGMYLGSGTLGPRQTLKSTVVTSVQVVDNFKKVRLCTVQDVNVD